MIKFVFTHILFFLPFICYSQNCNTYPCYVNDCGSTLSLQMWDDYGDGWNGYSFALFGGCNGAIYYQETTPINYTLPNGEYDYVLFNVPCGVWSIQVTGGNYGSEIYWELKGYVSGNLLAYGGAPYYSAGAAFTIGPYGGCPSGCIDPAAYNYNSDAYIQWDADYCEYDLVQGCTDSFALNYNPNANTDDGTCISPVYGCTDSLALNFNPNANTDDGTCISPVYGCTDSLALNYNPNANTDDGTCISPVYGCTDSLALNYNPNANTDDGTCISPVYGCTDSLALNYNPNANTDNGTCISPVYGCTDSLASNYNPYANINDSTCQNEIICKYVYIYINTGNNYSGEIHWEFYDDNFDNLLIYGGMSFDNLIDGGTTGGEYDDNQIYFDSLCLFDGCYSLVTYDTYGDGWNENGYFYITNQTGQYIVSPTIMAPNSGFDPDGTGYNSFPQYLITNIGIGVYDTLNCYNSNLLIAGCKDETAINYNQNALIDDGSCISPIYGCTNPSALNYNIDANTEDESCIYPVYGCTDENAENYNPNANVYDFSCIFSFVGCTDSLAINYDPIAQQDDETCIYCNLQIEYTVQNASLTTAGNISFNISGGSNNYSSIVFLNGEVQNPDHLQASDYILVIKDFTTGCDSVIYFSVLQELDDLNYGCIDTLANNFNPDANIDNGSCIYPKYGCIDPLACNFDLSATQDNGSCVYASPGYDCDSNCVAQDIDWIEIKLKMDL